MSRHHLTPLNPDHLVVVGWDGPLQTFFAQVEDTTAQPDPDTDEDPPLLLWLGLDEPVTDPAAMVAPLAPYAALDDAMLLALQHDRATAAPPTPLQHFASRLLFR